MASNSPSLPADYWQKITITKADKDFLHSHLFECETPMSVQELVGVLIQERIRSERNAQSKKRQAGGKVYLPKEKYNKGDKITFPALDWTSGVVEDVRPGVNPKYEDFEVLTVKFNDGTDHMFAAGLADHLLNEKPINDSQNDDVEPDNIRTAYGDSIETKLESAFLKDDGLVRIAGKWFPRALLVDVNRGHLNLAEAVLDMAAGTPLPTKNLLKDVELPDGVNPKLAEFSLNLALQEDDRFDEVGPAGQVLWCLNRLEPDNVREVPVYLQYTPIEYDRALLTEDMLSLEALIDDELVDASLGMEQQAEEVTISLIFPHWRAGTLPVTKHVESMFPTAYESPRVRFTLKDAKTGEIFPGWVVREKRYISGLRDWYESHGLIPGSLIRISRGKKPGEVVIEAKTHRTKKDWVRTVIVGVDGGVVFALLKQAVTAEFNDRMAFAIPTLDAIDQIWAQNSKDQRPLDQLVIGVMRDLTKLNPQGHVYLQELYAAINIMRRIAPAPLFALLASRPEDFIHVGDLHYRLGDGFGRFDAGE